LIFFFPVDFLPSYQEVRTFFSPPPSIEGVKLSFFYFLKEGVFPFFLTDVRLSFLWRPLFSHQVPTLFSVEICDSCLLPFFFPDLEGGGVFAFRLRPHKASSPFFLSLKRRFFFSFYGRHASMAALLAPFFPPSQNSFLSPLPTHILNRLRFLPFFFPVRLGGDFSSSVFSRYSASLSPSSDCQVFSLSFRIRRYHSPFSCWFLWAGPISFFFWEALPFFFD